MGYSVEMFAEIAALGLKPNRVLDIGAQDVAIRSQNELDTLNKFIWTSGSQQFLSIDTFPIKIEAKVVYERAGYSYTNIDVDERPGTLRVDLARFEIPRPRGNFDLVVNVGTTEHLASPIAAFALMHELCAEDGVLYHNVPLFGFGNHGLINPTPKFWHALMWMNRYSILSIKASPFDESSVDKGNIFHDYLNYIDGLSEIKNVTHFIRAIFKKISNTIFIVPFDAVLPQDNGFSLARLLAGSYRPFLATNAYSELEVLKSINDFLKLNNLPLVVSALEELEWSASEASGKRNAAQGALESFRGEKGE